MTGLAMMYFLSNVTELTFAILLMLRISPRLSLVR